MAETQLVLATSVKGAESTKKSLNDIKGSLDGMGESTKSLGSKLTAVGGSLLKFGAIGATALAGLGGLGLSMAGDFEQTSIAFKTMLGDGAKASLLLKDLSKFAAETPFEFPDIANAGKSLLAFGIEAGKVQGTLRRLGDVASSLNIPLGELSDIYGKAKVQGRLFAEDINQLTGRGIPIIQELAKVLGTTEGNIKTMVEKGKVGFPEIEKAFQNMTNEGGKFAGGMKNQSTSLNGLLSTAKDNMGQILREIIGINLAGEVATGSILDKAKTLVTSFVEFTSKNGDTIKAFLQSALDGFTTFFQVLGGIISTGLELARTFWAANGESIKANVQAIISSVQEFWRKYGNDIMIILQAIGFVFARAFDGVKLVVQSTMFIIGPLIQDVMTAIGGAFRIVAGILSGDFSKAWSGVKDLVSGIIQVLGDIILAFVDLVARAFGSDIVKTIDSTMSYLGQKAQEAKAFVSDILGQTAKIGNSFSIQGVSSMLSGARANGGPVGGGQSYLVGERGPEIFTPGTSGQIIPNNRIGGGGGGITINISGMFGQNAADEIGQHIINRLKGASYI